MTNDPEVLRSLLRRWLAQKPGGWLANKRTLARLQVETREAVGEGPCGRFSEDEYATGVCSTCGRYGADCTVRASPDKGEG